MTKVTVVPQGPAAYTTPTGRGISPGDVVTIERTERVEHDLAAGLLHAVERAEVAPEDSSKTRAPRATEPPKE